MKTYVMLSARILEIIPHTYPKRIRKRNATLLPFAVREVYDFAIEIGHETPKLITMIASNNSGI